MAMWHYSTNGNQLGPVEENELRSLMTRGVVSPDDFVWREGMADWIPASQANLQPNRPAPAAGSMPSTPFAGAPAPAMQSVPLAYAGPTVVSPVIQADDGPFMMIGKQVKLASGRWASVTLASPMAIYILKGRKVNYSHVGGHFGLLGLLLMMAFSKTDDTRTCDVTQLSPAIRTAFGRKGRANKGNVIILPKSAIRLVKPGMLGNISVYIGAECVELSTGLFGKGKAVTWLAENGWVIDQDVNPTTNPIHGVSFGRTAEEIEKLKPGPWKQIILVVIVLAIVALIIIGIASSNH